MTTQCYAMVRGSAMRVTGLDKRGGVPDLISFCSTRGVAKITVNEVVESGSNEALRNDEDELRIFLPRSGETIRYTADIEFSNTDPGLISLMSGNPVVLDASGNTVGFDVKTRLPAVSFAMEVWSKIAGVACVDGPRPHGYTVFPFLKGGVLSGFEFSNSRVSFALRGAQVQRGSRWGYGPYDLTGEGERLSTPVSRNLQFRQTLLLANPPAPSCGVQTFTEDIIDGGSASTTTSDIIDGGSASTTTSDIIDGGTAA